MRAVLPVGGRQAEKEWSAGPRINVADIYVAWLTKVDMGSARPCWRCVEWCRSGVKRIFHWNGDGYKFDVVKVDKADRDQYRHSAFRRNGETRLIIFAPGLWLF